MKLGANAVAVALVLLLSLTARAEHSVPIVDETGKGEGPSTPAPGSVVKDFNFDLLGDQASPVAAFHDPALDRDIAIRRTMLQVHQAAGFALLGMMAATMVLGQLNYSDRFAGRSTGKFERPHAVLAYVTTGTFAATGLLAVFAPNPFTKEAQGFDRLMLHRIGMYGAAAGMVAQIVLGIVTAHSEGRNQQAGLAVAHLAIGYASLGAMTLGVGALVF